MPESKFRKKFKELFNASKVILDWLILSIFMAIPVIIILGAINALTGTNRSFRIGGIRTGGLGTDFGLVFQMSLGFALIGGLLVVIRYVDKIWAWLKPRPTILWMLGAVILLGLSSLIFVNVRRTPTEKLADAIRAANVARVERVLSANEYDQSILDSQLVRTIRENNFEIAAVLIEYGANVNQTDYLGDLSLLIGMIKFGEPEQILFLLEQKVDVTVSNGFGKTPLIILIDERLPEQNMPQETGLMVVEMMLELGANPLIEDDFGLSAKDYAAERGYQNILALFP